MCNEVNQNEIITMTPSNQLDMTDDILAAANRRIAQLDKIVKLSISRTNENDWVDQGGKPYLTCSGAEKIARLFGVCWKDVESEKVISADETGQFYFYETSGTFTLGQDSIRAVGTCSQKDQFFAKSGKEMKPLSEIDETNIRKSSYSNMVVNGITRILGIRNLTWKEVQEGGINPGKTSKINYAQGSKGGKATSELIGIVSNLTEKEGISKSGKPYKMIGFDLKDKTGKIHRINTFDAKEIKEGYEVKASGLETKEYNGNISYTAKAIDIISEGIE